MAAAQLRAPLYEDKVVDWLFAKAEISDREVTREELEAAIESEEGFSTGTHSHDHENHKPKAKKAASKPAAKKAAKASADDAHEMEAADIEPAAPGDELVEAEPVKKAATKKAPAKAKAEAEPTEEAAAEAPAKKPAAKKAAAKKAE